MLKNLQKEWRNNFSSTWQMIAIMAAGWGLGELITVLVLLLAKDADTYFSLGGILGLATLLIFGVFLSVYYFTVGFDQALCMGRTRRAYLCSMTLTAWAQLLLGTVAAVALSNADALIRNTFFRGIPDDGPFYGVLSLDWVVKFWWAFLFGPLAVVLCGFMAGAMVKRFSRKALWFFWGVYMVVVLFGSSIAKLLESHDTTTLAGRIVNGAAALLPVGLLPAAAALGTVGLLGYSIYVLLRAKVDA